MHNTIPGFIKRHKKRRKSGRKRDRISAGSKAALVRRVFTDRACSRKGLKTDLTVYKTCISRNNVFGICITGIQKHGRETITGLA